MVKILHIQLKPLGEDDAQFRFFWDNPDQFQSRTLSLSDISSHNRRAEMGYYTRLPEPYDKTGQVLYNWLDGSDRLLQSALNQYQRESIVLAIAASGKLAHLPWELLHDGQRFLVERLPAIVPVRWVGDGDFLTVANQPKNRYLNVLFMATSPDGVEPQLDFEAEEGRILEATQGKRSLCLEVEESGNVEELGALVSEYGAGYFDVIHLTGHAEIGDNNNPYFITETEYGERKDSSAEDIARALQFQEPQLIFLSGCRTGYLANEGAVPSMAQELLANGATAVLGWGDRVADTEATAAAAIFYKELSKGQTVTQALALTYQTLVNKIQMPGSPGQHLGREWHLLRFYIAQFLPGALVTSPNTPGRRPARCLSIVPKFIDTKKKLRLLPRSEFVGRRRQLQNCLRTLRNDFEKVGVLLQGFGGWGKSAIAARICDRLSDYEPLVFWRDEIDHSSLVQALAEKLRDRKLRRNLQDNSEDLRFRLRDLFEELNETGKKWLLVLDDFEWNLEHREGSYILRDDIASLLEELVWAIQETYAQHRIIITCRYNFKSDLLTHFYQQEMDNFHHSELQKKLRRLNHFNSESLDECLKQRALKLADGNPRLLEWLDEEVVSHEDAEAKLTEYETRTDLWQEKVIWNQENTPELQIDSSLERILSRLLVYQIHVPMPALEAVCESKSDYREINRARDKGLIGVSPSPIEANQLYRVSHIIPCQLPKQPRILYPLYRKAYEALSQCRGNWENESEEKWREIFRLLFADKENSLRFRQGFSQMLGVQEKSRPGTKSAGPISDQVLEAELRRLKDELSEKNLCVPLKDYLHQGDWRKADEETAWLFYLVMVKQGYQYWKDMLREFPSETLNKIDQLWVNYSQGQFGFSIQKRIAFGQKPRTWDWKETWRLDDSGVFVEQETWDTFSKQLGWEDKWNRVGVVWGEHDNLNFLNKSPEGQLPALVYQRFFAGSWKGMWNWGNSIGFCELLAKLNQ